MSHESVRIDSAIELDAFIGHYITAEEPEIFWEDSHGQFQFDTEEEARRAIADPFFQRFLPDVDWAKTVIRQVRAYRPYCAEPGLVWLVVEKASAAFGSLVCWRDHGRWYAAFGGHPPTDARTSAVAICLAALRAHGFTLEVDHDRVDAQINQYALHAQMESFPTPDQQP